MKNTNQAKKSNALKKNPSADTRKNERKNSKASHASRSLSNDKAYRKCYDTSSSFLYNNRAKDSASARYVLDLNSKSPKHINPSRYHQRHERYQLMMQHFIEQDNKIPKTTRESDQQKQNCLSFHQHQQRSKSKTPKQRNRSSLGSIYDHLNGDFLCGKAVAANKKPISSKIHAHSHSKSSYQHQYQPPPPTTTTKRMGKNQFFVKRKQMRPGSSAASSIQKISKPSKRQLFESVKFQKSSHYEKKTGKKNNTINLNKSRNEPKKKQRTSISNTKKTIQPDAVLRRDHEQEKLLQKLFKGIEFYRSLGKGEQASVRSAINWNTNKKIAIKTYQKDKLSNQNLRSIEQQVQILTSVSHTNVIKLYQIIESYKTVFFDQLDKSIQINLVMQYGGGNSLEQFMKGKAEGFLSEEIAATIFRQILEAVKCLEEQCIAHRDLKPANILLNKHLQVKIIDFGLAVICNSFLIIYIIGQKGQNISSPFCGTPAFMAPQIVNRHQYNPHLADRWSLGVLLYTMLNGSCPFKAASQAQLFEKIKIGSFNFLVNLSKEVSDLIYALMKVNPQQRISADEAFNSSWMKKLQKEETTTGKIEKSEGIASTKLASDNVPVSITTATTTMATTKNVITTYVG